MAKAFSASVLSQTTPAPNQSVFRAVVIKVLLTGTPIQFPDIPIPDGIDLMIKAKATNGAKRVYLADSSLNTGDITKRIELRSGEAIGLSITDANLVWIDASGNNAEVELLVEA